jgi:hypothetical protein
VSQDPVVRFLGGCAIVAAVFAAIVVCVAVGVGWNLTRDPAPGRARESFLLGDESRYWCVDLKPDDAGLRSFLERLNAVSENTRRRVLRGTFLEMIPLPHRRARLEDIAPFTLEGSLILSDPANGPQVPLGWAARGTFSHEVLRMRAALKGMRWLLGRDPTKGTTIDVDGVAVTEVRDNGAAFAIANVGNRVLATSDASRMRSVLRSSAEPSLEGLRALHDDVELKGEDGWAFVSRVRVGGLSDPVVVPGAVASFDVTERDELAFRVAVRSGASTDEARVFRGSREECLALISTFLPVFRSDAIELDAEGARPGAGGSTVFSGRIPVLSKYLPELPNRITEFALKASAKRLEREAQPPPEPGAPSAIPIPPSPPPPAGPRTGTPGERTHGETPKPPR